jgi:NADH dehydrogenase
MPRLVVTGANSAVGRVLLERALGRADVEIVAVVRSQRAASELPALTPGRARVARVDWSDSAGLREACAGAAGLIHLAGILIPTRAASYAEANEATATAALAAARDSGVAKLVLLSAVGADARSRNAYFKSKGLTEDLVRADGAAWTILRLPLVLACDAQGSKVLAKLAHLPFVALPGGGANLEQPIDARDVADAALAAALAPSCANGATLELVGPESLARRELVARCARLLGKSPRVVPVPISAVRAVLALRETLLGPGFSRDVLDVILSDVRLDPQLAAAALGLRLRSLDETLARTLKLAA